MLNEPAQESEWAALAFDMAPIGIVLTEERLISACNATFAELTGYAPGELIGQSFRIFYGSDGEFERVRDVGLTPLRASQPYSDERLLRHRDGRDLWCRFRARTLLPETPLKRVIMSFGQISDAAPARRLSKREREVLGFIGQGLTTKEIAARLDLSPRTIDDVRGRLIRRYGVRRASDLLGHFTDLRFRQFTRPD